MAGHWLREKNDFKYSSPFLLAGAVTGVGSISVFTGLSLVLSEPNTRLSCDEDVKNKIPRKKSKRMINNIV